MAGRGASARRYAEAVFELAAENGTLDAWSRDLSTIARFAGEPQVAGILANSRVPASERIKLLTAGLQQQIEPLAWNLVRLLESRNKIHLADGIQRAYQEMADDRAGVAHATVTTAVPLSDDERNAVAARLSSLTGKQVDVTPVVDDNIIGGVVARIGDQLIDGSTRTKLLALKRQLAASTR